jgi:hypothetical protein
MGLRSSFRSLRGRIKRIGKPVQQDEITTSASAPANLLIHEDTTRAVSPKQSSEALECPPAAASSPGELEAGILQHTLEAGILQHTLEYVGPGHWWYVALVSKRWAATYVELESVQVRQSLSPFSSYRGTICCTPKMTLRSSVLASASRLLLAHDSGLSVNTQEFQYAAGAQADIATLKAARMLGMKYTALTAAGAARCNEFAVLQFLDSQYCCWDESVCEAAANRGDLAMLQWLRRRCFPWHLSDVLCAAAASGSVELLVWVMQQSKAANYAKLAEHVLHSAALNGSTAVCAHLLEQGCPCDAEACYCAAARGHADTLRCLREHGCSLPACSSSPDIFASIHTAAAASGSIATMAYLLQHAEESLSAVELTEMLNAAGTLHHTISFQACVERNPTIGQATTEL